MAKLVWNRINSTIVWCGVIITVLLPALTLCVIPCTEDSHFLDIQNSTNVYKIFRINTIHVPTDKESTQKCTVELLDMDIEEHNFGLFWLAVRHYRETEQADCYSFFTIFHWNGTMEQVYCEDKDIKVHTRFFDFYFSRSPNDTTNYCAEVYTGNENYRDRQIRGECTTVTDIQFTATPPTSSTATKPTTLSNVTTSITSSTTLNTSTSFPPLRASTTTSPLQTINTITTQDTTSSVGSENPTSLLQTSDTVSTKDTTSSVGSENPTSPFQTSDTVSTHDTTSSVVSENQSTTSSFPSASTIRTAQNYSTSASPLTTVTEFPSTINYENVSTTSPLSTSTTQTHLNLSTTEDPISTSAFITTLNPSTIETRTTEKTDTTTTTSSLSSATPIIVSEKVSTVKSQPHKPSDVSAGTTTTHARENSAHSSPPNTLANSTQHIAGHSPASDSTTQKISSVVPTEKKIQKKEAAVASSKVTGRPKTHRPTRRKPKPIPEDKSLDDQDDTIVPLVIGLVIGLLCVVLIIVVIIVICRDKKKEKEGQAAPIPAKHEPVDMGTQPLPPNVNVVHPQIVPPPIVIDSSPDSIGTKAIGDDSSIQDDVNNYNEIPEPSKWPEVWDVYSDTPKPVPPISDTPSGPPGTIEGVNEGGNQVASTRS